MSCHDGKPHIYDEHARCNLCGIPSPQLRQLADAWRKIRMNQAARFDGIRTMEELLGPIIRDQIRAEHGAHQPTEAATARQAEAPDEAGTSTRPDGKGHPAPA